MQRKLSEIRAWEDGYGSAASDLEVEGSTGNLSARGSPSEASAPRLPVDRVQRSAHRPRGNQGTTMPPISAPGVDSMGGKGHAASAKRVNNAARRAFGGRQGTSYM